MRRQGIACIAQWIDWLTGMVRLGPIKELCAIGETEDTIYIVRSQKIGENRRDHCKGILFMCSKDLPWHAQAYHHRLPWYAERFHLDSTRQGLCRSCHGYIFNEASEVRRINHPFLSWLGIPWSILTNFIQGHFHIPSNIWISIFINGQAGRCVLNEQVAKPNFDLRKIRSDGLCDIIRDQMAPTRRCGNGNLFLKEFHRWDSWCWIGRRLLKRRKSTGATGAGLTMGKQRKKTRNNGKAQCEERQAKGHFHTQSPSRWDASQAYFVLDFEGR